MEIATLLFIFRIAVIPAHASDHGQDNGRGVLPWIWDERHMQDGSRVYQVVDEGSVVDAYNAKVMNIFLSLLRLPQVCVTDPYSCTGSLRSCLVYVDSSGLP